jgi:hypothetical protein
MKLVVVPGCLQDAINAKIDGEIAKLPEALRPKAEECRDHMYHELLSYFDEHGVIPDCHIVANMELSNKEPNAEPEPRRACEP